MKQYIENFNQQITQAIALGEKYQSHIDQNKVENVLILGLGGSGIGGTIISQLLADKAKCPIEVCKGYFIPEYVGEKTLVIVSSYSGNTEETLSTLNQAADKGAQFVCITSGGKLQEIAQSKPYDAIIIPQGYPPRAAFAFSSVQLIYILEKCGIVPQKTSQNLNGLVDLLNSHSALIQKQAKEIAALLLGKTPIIYCETSFEGVAIRLRQQINENAKMLCWHHVIPEMNHNELVGWREKDENKVVILFRNDDDYYRNKTRMEINKTIIGQYAGKVVEIFSKGNNKIQKAYYLIHLGDWLSYYLAELKGVDSIEVNVIDYLKGELAKA